jgi:hypothetical protein
LDADTAWATPYQEACYVENCPPITNTASVWHTSDGGNTWQEGQVCLQGPECNFDFAVSPEYYNPISLYFPDDHVGWLLVTVSHTMSQDRYCLYQTLDGGIHWSIVMDSLTGPMVMSMTGMAFQDERTGWLSSSQINGAVDPSADMSIDRSTDGGLTWEVMELPAPDPLPETFADHTVSCGAIGLNRIPSKALDVTIQCEVYTDPPTSYDFQFHSPDDGKNWISWPKTGDVEFINPLVGWRSTLNQDVYDLEQTQDGGQTWTKIKSVQWNGDLDFVNEQVGWAIAATGGVVALVHTIDGGKTWEEIKPVVAAH